MGHLFIFGGIAPKCLLSAAYRTLDDRTHPIADIHRLPRPARCRRGPHRGGSNRRSRAASSRHATTARIATSWRATTTRHDVAVVSRHCRVASRAETGPRGGLPLKEGPILLWRGYPPVATWFGRPSAAGPKSVQFRAREPRRAGILPLLMSGLYTVYFGQCTLPARLGAFAGVFALECTLFCDAHRPDGRIQSE